MLLAGKEGLIISSRTCGMIVGEQFVCVCVCVCVLMVLVPCI